VAEPSHDALQRCEILRDLVCDARKISKPIARMSCRDAAREPRSRDTGRVMILQIDGK
jgi:hypothetical protein